MKLKTMYFAKDMRVIKPSYRKNFEKIKKRKSRMKVKSKSDFKTIYKL